MFPPPPPSSHVTRRGNKTVLLYRCVPVFFWKSYFESETSCFKTLLVRSIFAFSAYWFDNFHLVDRYIVDDISVKAQFFYASNHKNPSINAKKWFIRAKTEGRRRMWIRRKYFESCSAIRQSLSEIFCLERISYFSAKKWT